MKIRTLLIVIFILCNNLLMGQTVKRWDYPIKPGTSQWSKLKTYEERLNAYNIPDGILQSMKTSDLVQTCLNYPEFRLIMTRNSFQQGYDYLKTIFNGFSELEKRKDAGKELIKLYKNIDPKKINEYDTKLKRGKFAFKRIYVEIIAAQPPILVNLNKADRKVLLKAALSNFGVIDSNKEDYSVLSLIPPSLIMGRLLECESYLELKDQKYVKCKNFLIYTHLSDRETLDTIVVLAKKYLTQIDHE